jgi:hypothetical protein
MQAGPSPSVVDPYRLSPEQVEAFHRDGFVGPLTACTPDEMVAYEKQIVPMLQTKGIGGHADWHNRHLDCPFMWELSTRPQIVGPMASVMGDDLLMWRTNFFNKEPGGKEIPWHQDRNYWPLEPEIVISAWLAIDAATTENACVQILPGTHRKLVPHIPAGPEMQFNEQADLTGIDTSGMIDMELQPGEFFLFNERTLHHSHPNRSNKRRMGLAIRVIIPQVRVLDYDSDAHDLMVIHGRDPLGFNRLGNPPQ